MEFTGCLKGSHSRALSDDLDNFEVPHENTTFECLSDVAAFRRSQLFPRIFDERNCQLLKNLFSDLCHLLRLSESYPACPKRTSRQRLLDTLASLRPCPLARAQHRSPVTRASPSPVSGRNTCLRVMHAESSCDTRG